jgi:predicted ATP-grasp superfamily ATP-dependent carboligase
VTSPAQPSGPRLVHIVDEVPELEGVRALPMVVALDGFLDAGNAGALAAAHLVRTGGSSPEGGGVVVATFDVDQLHDYRARRPPMTFARDHYEGYEAPRLVVRLLHDEGGSPYLLLHGPEPDTRWEGFCRAVLEVIERFEVALVVAIGSVPMAVPHTRPIAITHHANNPALLTGSSPWRGELRVPSSAQALLEVRLGEWGHDAQGFVAHVPHYLAQLDYPRASASLLEQVELAARLTIDLTELTLLAEARDEEIARYLAANEEVREVVVALEQQYDTFARAEEEGSSLLAQDEPLPTGEEIGEQFEQFLAGLEGPDEQGRDS